LNIREKCLIQTNLKSEQISVLEKIIGHLGYLQPFYQEITVRIPAKDENEIFEFSRKIDKQEKPGIRRDWGKKNIKTHVPLFWGTEMVSGEIVLWEKKGSPQQKWEEFMALCRNTQNHLYPDNYLVPDGMMVFDALGKMQFCNYVADSISYRLGLEGLSLHEAAQLWGINEQKYEDFVSRRAFFSTFLHIDQFYISILVNPVVAAGEFFGAMVLISDLSLVKQKERELIAKSTVIKEIHHRVKNNLQTITSLLRLQMRRTNLKVVDKVFTESINRILSIALIHEALSKQDIETINIKQTSYNILQMILSNMVDNTQRINGEIYGDDVYLSATVASHVSLCITELVQNAVEHGFVNRLDGNIRISVEKTKDEIIIMVKDNGVGISSANIQQGGSLGMELVNTIIQDNLKGSFIIEGHRYGTTACIRFPQPDLEVVD